MVKFGFDSRPVKCSQAGTLACCTWRNKPHRGSCRWRLGTFGVVLSYTLKMKEVGLLGPGLAAVDCCVVVAGELQAEFIYEHVEGAKAVAGTRVGSVEIHDYVGVVGGLDEELYEEPVRRPIVASLWRGQLSESVHHMPVHSGCSPRVVVVAQEVDGLPVFPSNGTQTSPAPEFVLATLGQPLTEFLVVVLAAWHDCAHGQDSQFVLQHVEQRGGVVETVHEQHVVLVGNLRVFHQTADDTASWSKAGPVEVLDPARVDFCIENVACLRLAEQEALDAPSDWLVTYVWLDGEAVLGGNHALAKAELLADAVIAAKEREHSVEHGPHFVNLVGLVHGLVRLVHDFPETGAVRIEVVAGPLPVALIPRLDHTLLHLKPKAKECFQLGDSDGLKILGKV